MRIGPGSLHGLPEGAGLRSRKQLGHYKAFELAIVGSVVLAVLFLFTASAGLLCGLGGGLPLPVRASILSAAAITILCMLYAGFVESRTLTVRRIALRSPKVKGRALRLLHVSDPHVGRWKSLYESVVSAARELEPDLIFMTGDYTDVPCRFQDSRRLIAELAALAPTYCCRGNGDYRPPPVSALFDGTGATLLMNESRELIAAGSCVRVAGIDPGNEEGVLSAPDAGPGTLSICLYHYPDLVPKVSEIPFDLMLCGHTHGGQVRLPLIGALTSLSRVGPRYCRGLFSSGDRHAFVTQGVGTESYGLASLRFLCPPEVVLITVMPPAGG